MLQSTIDIRVRYAETDMMGFAYHGNYAAWFEMARIRMLDQIDYPYRQMEDEGYRLPVLELQIAYGKPVTFDDRLTVEATMREKPSIRFRIDYRVLRDATVTAEGFTRHAFIDTRGRPIRPPKRFLALTAPHFAAPGNFEL